MSRLQITAEQVLGVVTIAADGEVDVYTLGKLKEAVTMALSTGLAHLVIDLGGVTYMDSSGLGLLLGLHKQLEKARGRLIVTGPSAAVREVFRVTNADRLLKVMNTREEAARCVIEAPFTPPAGSDRDRK
ncbi:MAG TPA: STAS domain-containing protein [Candidatus Ozemobacteraceae bacterium]|nr:STAS domain-containing protein [Candidatus Ozemobacteraceae bacterium]